MDFAGNELLGITATIGSVIAVAFSAVSICFRRQSSNRGQVLKQGEWTTDDISYQYFPCNSNSDTNDTNAVTTPLPRLHKRLNLRWNSFIGIREPKSPPLETNSAMPPCQDEGIKEEFAEDPPKPTEHMPTFITCFVGPGVNNENSLEEQTAVAEIGTTSTQKTNTISSSMQSHGNLNSNLINLNRTLSRSNSIYEVGNGSGGGGGGKELVAVPEAGGLAMASDVGGDGGKGRCYPHCHGVPCSATHNLTKQRSKDRFKRMPKKEMLNEYKLSEPVAVMIQKYEEKSRLENDQDDCNLY